MLVWMGQEAGARGSAGTHSDSSESALLPAHEQRVGEGGVRCSRLSQGVFKGSILSQGVVKSSCWSQGVDMGSILSQGMAMQSLRGLCLESVMGSVSSQGHDYGQVKALSCRSTSLLSFSQKLSIP